MKLRNLTSCKWWTSSWCRSYTKFWILKTMVPNPTWIATISGFLWAVVITILVSDKLLKDAVGGTDTNESNSLVWMKMASQTVKAALVMKVTKLPLAIMEWCNINSRSWRLVLTLYGRSGARQSFMNMCVDRIIQKKDHLLFMARWKTIFTWLIKRPCLWIFQIIIGPWESSLLMWQFLWLSI